jgi:DNA polymerase elongation subunit (family B)
LGEGKVEYEGMLDDVYEKDINKFIRYSKQDTNLLYELNKKLGHIELREEIRKVCSSTWKATESTMGYLDPLCISYAKNKGLVCRTSQLKKDEDSLPGAYVRTPVAGLHSWLVDFDFSSLYPSIIRTMNIGPNTLIGKIDQKIAQLYLYEKDKLPNIIDVNIEVIDDEKETIHKMDKESFLKWLEYNKAIVTIAGTIFKGQEIELSFFSEILKYVGDSREKYKNQMKIEKEKKNDALFKLYKNKQMVFKVISNAIYGVLGNFAFRFFKLDLAKSITLTGQEAIKFAGFHCGQYMKTENTNIDNQFLQKYEDEFIPYLLYTDTDSIFVSVFDWLSDTGKI